ncbi:MAG: ribose-phosphate pyrophosphokinase [Candidatus Eisenbacteria sp.]|nr:ribose-phosphate pyrophosphokinase [Candidatus Eisenbacteria bacterium]
MEQELKIFSGTANRPLADQIAAYLDIALGDVEVSQFEDGETFVKFNENVRGVDVFIIQPTDSPASNMLELLLMLDAAKRASAKRVTAVIPYFGYARQDRKDQPRVSIAAKLVANLITTAGADRVLTMDLHASQIQGFFDIPMDHLFAAPVIKQYFESLKVEDAVVVPPDLGGTKMARSLAAKLDLTLALIDKRRTGPDRSEALNVIGDVEGRQVFIVDDLISTAGTVCEAARVLKESGAGRIYMAATHAVFSGNALERLNEAPFEEVGITNTIQIARRPPFRKIRILSVAELLGEAILRIHRSESVSILFE